MRTYGIKEKEGAKEKLPESIRSFLNSEVLPKIYIGIKDKLKLNLRQLMLFAEVANVTLMGLEPEHALETNLHQYLPELSNAEMRELAADINDRVFKEAQRRLRENVVEKNTEDEAATEGADETSASVAEMPEYVLPVGTKTKPEKEQSTTAVSATPAPSIAMEKLSTQMESKPRDVSLKVPVENGIGQISIPPVAHTPVPSGSSLPNPPVPQAPRVYPGGTDPYREPIE